MLVNEYEGIEIVQGSNEEEEEEKTKEVVDSVELDLKSVIGFSTLGLMKVKGVIGERKVVVLIDDCGATHNFVPLQLVEELKLPKTHTSNYGIVMGDGTPTRGKRVFKGITLTLAELTITEDFLPWDLGGVDFLLGMQ